MITLAQIMTAFESDFRAQYRDRLTSAHLRALAAMKRCRTQASAKMLVQCGQCAHQVLVPHSCGHRQCPHCQHHESQQWLERQLQKQLPTPYFLLTFTLPAELRPLAFAHQRLVYDLILRCSWETVNQFSHNDKRLRGTPGAIAVLHTHTRALDYHPHVHLVVPAAAIEQASKQWRIKQPRGDASYLFNHKALAAVFRAKMLTALRAAGINLPIHYPGKWVADCKAVGSGQKALIYLGRYLYRGVMPEKDIVTYDSTQVTFRYRDAKTKRYAHKTVTGANFLWLVLQHVLPKGFRRTRNFGFLHPNAKRMIALLHLLLRFVPTIPAWMKPRPPMTCACCGGVMLIIKTKIRTVFCGPAPGPFSVGGSL
jgi:Putative transposase/Transposase zinc-binding domain